MAAAGVGLIVGGHLLLCVQEGLVLHLVEHATILISGGLAGILT